MMFWRRNALWRMEKIEYRLTMLGHDINDVRRGIKDLAARLDALQQKEQGSGSDVYFMGDNLIKRNEQWKSLRADGVDRKNEIISAIKHILFKNRSMVVDTSGAMDELSDTLYAAIYNGEVPNVVVCFKNRESAVAAKP